MDTQNKLPSQYASKILVLNDGSEQIKMYAHINHTMDISENILNNLEKRIVKM